MMPLSEKSWVSTPSLLPSAQGPVGPEFRPLSLFKTDSTLGAPIRLSLSPSFSADELLMFSISGGIREATLFAFLLTARLGFLALLALAQVGFLLSRLVFKMALLGALLLPVDLSPLCLRKFLRVMTFCLHCTLIGRVSRIVGGILPAASSSRQLLIFGAVTVVLQSRSPVTLSFFQTSAVSCCNFDHFELLLASSERWATPRHQSIQNL